MSADGLDWATDGEDVDPDTGELDPTDQQTITCVYADVLDFVHNYLLETFRKPAQAKNYRWCPEWWEHAEARRVLRALWVAWEKANHEGELAGWFRDLGYPLFDRLLSESGPFSTCHITEGHTLGGMTRLPTAEPPSELPE